MKRIFANILENTIAGMTFLTMLCLHVYFALLILAKPAFAEEISVPTTPQATEKQQDAKTPPAPAKSSKASKIDLGSDINVKFNMKEGLTIKGLDKTIEKLDAIDKKGGHVKIDEDGIEVSDDEGEKVWINKNIASPLANILEEVLVPIMFFLSVFGFAAYTVYSKHRTRREYLETIKTLAQSGKEIPPELMSGLNGLGGGAKLLSNRNQYDESAIPGIKLMFIAIGICVFFIVKETGHVGYAIASIFLVMGAFKIYVSQMISKQKKQDTVLASEVVAPYSPDVRK